MDISTPTTAKTFPFSERKLLPIAYMPFLARFFRLRQFVASDIVGVDSRESFVAVCHDAVSHRDVSLPIRFRPLHPLTRDTIRDQSACLPPALHAALSPSLCVWPQGLGGSRSGSTYQRLVQYRELSLPTLTGRAAVITCLRQTPEAGSLARADGTAADLTGGRGGNGCLISAAHRAILDQELGLLGSLPTWARILLFTCLHGLLSARLVPSGELMLSSHCRCHGLA
jgi:hypothetical protein